MVPTGSRRWHAHLGATRAVRWIEAIHDHLYYALRQCLMSSRWYDLLSLTSRKLLWKSSALISCRYPWPAETSTVVVPSSYLSKTDEATKIIKSSVAENDSAGAQERLTCGEWIKWRDVLCPSLRGRWTSKYGLSRGPLENHEKDIKNSGIRDSCRKRHQQTTSWSTTCCRMLGARRREEHWVRCCKRQREMMQQSNKKNVDVKQKVLTGVLTSRRRVWSKMIWRWLFCYAVNETSLDCRG